MSNDFRSLKYVKNVEGNVPAMPLLERLISVTSSPEQVMPWRATLQQLPDTMRFSSLFSPDVSIQVSNTPK